MARLKEELLNELVNPAMPEVLPPAPAGDSAINRAVASKVTTETLPKPTAPEDLKPAQPTLVGAEQQAAANIAGLDYGTAKGLGFIAPTWGEAEAQAGINISNMPAGEQAQFKNPSMTASQRDASQAFISLLAGYGIKDEPGKHNLVDAITQYAIEGYSGETMSLMMQNPNGTDALAQAFQKRFPANKLRAAKGLTPYSVDQYLNYENSYKTHAATYQMGSLANDENITNFLVNNIAPDVVAKAADAVYNHVLNSDPTVLQQMKTYFPTLTIGDVASVLIGGETVDSLNKKITEAEIGSAGLLQGLPVSLKESGVSLGAEALANLGYDKGTALKGYQEVAQKLPGFQQLSGRYGQQTGLAYDQKTAEQSTFQGQAKAIQQEQTLNAYEQAQFRKKYGVSVDAGSLERTGGSQSMMY